MKPIQKHLLKLACLGVLCALPAYGSEPESSPSPSPTASASPSATPRIEPSPTATPHDEPSASPSPSASPGGDDHGTSPSPSPSASPGGDDHGPSPSPTPSASPGDDDHHGGDDRHGDVSLHGLFEGTTSTGGLAVIYVEGNSHVQIHLLSAGNQTIGFAEGALTNGSFSLTLTTGELIVGTAQEDGINVTFGNQSFVAARVSEFGEEHDVAGRYTGVANGPNGESRVTFLIEPNKNIIMIQRTGTVLTGGFGTITAPVAPATDFTFTLTNSIGSSSTITGSFSIVNGVFSGTFHTSSGTFTVNTFKSSLANRIANISTRGLVGEGQGQLIGGFIITGGPKLVMIRAIGPSLAATGVSPALENPNLQLFSGATLLASNDDWKSNANAADITATGIPPTNDLESALLVRLEPGAYTTVVTGNGGATGIALVEIYEVGSD